jgi:hypothetical protein
LLEHYRWRRANYSRSGYAEVIRPSGNHDKEHRHNGEQGEKNEFEHGV